MASFFGSLPGYFQIYLIIGVIVFLAIWKSFAYRCANRVGGYVSGHRVSSFKDMGNKPTWFDYLLCLGWAPPMIMGWPVVLLYYLMGFNNSGKK